MNDFQQRTYYKLHTGTNQEDGYDKIYLGYQASNTEIILKKDQTTYFHIPYFTQVVNISSTTLIKDGATPGPVPALADRIYKKTGNYGNHTHLGNPLQKQNGEWLCSWLYALSSELPVWLDRYFYPGRISYEEALESMVNYEDYKSHNPVYYDVPSALTLEPGTWFKYDHIGEKTAVQIVSSFGGSDQTHTRLNIENWSNDFKDSSIFNNTIQIENFNNNWITQSSEINYIDRSVLNFNNTDFIDAKVIYDESYFLENEFSLLFWVNNDDWSKATTTQLLGNYNDGGYGVFYNNLKNFPYFVVSENTYGHLFYFNQEFLSYYDKSTQIFTGSPTNAPYVAINGNSEIFVLNSQTKKVYKYNHAGTVLGQTVLSSGAFFSLSGTPHLMSIDKNNNVIVTTTVGTYTFDQCLIFKDFDKAYPYITDLKKCFNTNGDLITEYNCTDIIFDKYNNKWVINSIKQLLCNDEFFEPFVGSGTNLAIDPEDNLWVLYDSNKIIKINPLTKQIISNFEIGNFHTGLDKKNISFIYQNDRKNNKQQWYGLIIHNYEKTLYQITLDGEIVKSIFLPDKLNVFDPLFKDQNTNLLTFTTDGDFTGYEWQRIFHPLLYENKEQLQFKVSLKQNLPSLPNYTETFSVPINYVANKIWYLIGVTLKNQDLTIYVNGIKLKNFKVPKEYTFDYTLKNNLYIGCPCGEAENLNKEINSKAIIWNGYIDSIKIYDYALKPEFLKYFLYAKTIAQDIIWNIPTSNLQYIEGIDRIFKHRIPGFKSQFFNVKIVNSQITDENTKSLIQDSIEDIIQQIKPIHTELLSIEWVD